jgi:uncharacterized protein (UPF0333 family)
MNKKQKGFASLESLLILVIIVMIVFVGWFVWHARSQADKSLNDTLSSAQSQASHKSKKQVTAPAKKAVAQPKIVTFTSTSNSNGTELTSPSDIDKLDGASDTFKDFVKDKVNKGKAAPSPCGNAYGLFIQKIYKDQFALGAESQCKHTDKLWAKVSDQWTEISSTDTKFDCSILEQYKVPVAIVDQCIKNGQTVSNPVTTE